MRRRLALGRILLGRPSLVLLDEPTSALDADGVDLVERLLAAWREAGVTVLVASHSVDRLCELNVLEQAANVCRTTIVQDAWRRGQPLQVHGWIYRLQNGLIRDLGMVVMRDGMLDAEYERALRELVGFETSRPTPTRT